MPMRLPQAWWVSVRLLVCAVTIVGAGACERAKAPTTSATGQVDTASAAVSQVAGTATGPALPEAALRAHVWSCADGQKIVQRNLSRERAIAIDLHDGTRRLEQTSSGSGARYEDAVVIFWTKGNSATLQRKGSPVVQCQELREASLREDARLRDVH